MEGYSHSPIIDELIPNPENHHDRNDHDHVGNLMSEEDTSSLPSQPRRNQSSPNSIVSDENINPLEDQLQSLRIDSVRERLFHGNSTNQQTLAGNSRIGPSHPYEGVLRGHNIINEQTLAAENSGIGQTQSYERLLHGNNIINQHVQAARNFGIGPIDAYDRLPYDGNYPNQQTLVGNPEIGPSHIHNSSPLIRQRNNNITSLADVRGRVVSMSKEEYGSELLVKVLDGKKPGDIKFILMDVLDHIHDLMMDWFGKHVIEKFFDVLDVDQLTCLFEVITKSMLEFQIVCENDIGCTVIQNMIDHFSKERQMIIFTNALKKIVVPMATSQNGSYVLHHFLKLCPPPFSKEIFDAMALECTHIAKDKTGCSVLQTCLFSDTTPESYIELIRAVTNRALLLAPHPYGNYVVQFVIKLRLHEINGEMVNQLRYSYVGLSMNKHGSNVVEKLLRFSTQKYVGIIVEEIMYSPRFLELLRNVYGNYVAQRALECSKGALHDMLMLKILQHFNNLITDPYGRRVIEFMNGGGRYRAQF